MADVGLAALIARVLGASAVKTGIFGKIVLIFTAVLKKLWIVVIVSLSFLKSKFGRKTT